MGEYEHTPDGKKALRKLIALSQTSQFGPWSCVVLPNQIECGSGDFSRTGGYDASRIWDFVVAGLLLDCQPEKIDALTPEKLPPGYYSDLWLVRREILETLQRDPQYLLAQQRWNFAQTLHC